MSARIEDALAYARQPFVVPARASRHVDTWVAAFHAASLPLLAWGPEQRYRATVEGAKVQITCVGLRRRFRELLDGLFGSVEHVDTGPPRAAWSPDRLSEVEGDVVLSEVHHRFVASFRRAGWVIVPETVRWCGRLAELPTGTPPKSLRSDMAKVRKQGYTREVSDSDADWREFFDRMLLPHATARFEDTAHVPSSLTMRQLRNKGRLLFIRHGNRRVGGGCILPTGRWALFERLGIRDGDVDLMRDGALAALYLFAIDWARDRGFEYFDAGSTLPFPDDGLARYKAKFGLTSEANPFALSTGFHVRRGSVLERVLGRRPVYRVVGDRVEAYPE